MPRWPTAEQFGLDSSQYDAIKLALTSKLALIQGPPGTGKTFIGVKIVELLLHNRSLWWDNSAKKKSPILMICYTNHALDQFLELIVRECKLSNGVVRVGGRCKSDSLEPFLLRNVKKTNAKNIEGDIFYRIRDEYARLADLNNVITETTKQVIIESD